MNTILEGITIAYGGSYEMKYDRGTPALINDPALSRQMIPTMERIVGKEKLMTLDPVMGGEDFAVFANEVPGLYFRLGVVKPGTTSGWIHTPKFRADDSSLEVGIRVMSNIILDYLQSSVD